MKIKINNQDYTYAARPKLRIERRLNRPDQMKCVLASSDPQFIVPVAGDRVVISREDGFKLFTGYLVAAPEYEYLGWAATGPAYRYSLRAIGDQIVLDRKLLPQRAPFIQRAAGDVLKQLVESLAPGVFNTAAVQPCGTLPQFYTSLQRAFSEQAADLALRARAAYRLHDGAVSLALIGAVTHVLDTASAYFSPQTLLLSAPQQQANDVIAIGRVEPRAHIRDYFLGDGISTSFILSHTPFTRRAQTLMEEEFTAALDSRRWTLSDPAGAITLNSGALQVNGGGCTLSFAEQLELGGALVMQHGEVSFTSASDGILGGLYSGTFTTANCFAGFQISPSGASTIGAIVQGANAGTTLATVAGHRYALTTRIFSTEPFRAQQTFHSSTATRGGASVPANVRLVLEVHDIDPANPATLQNRSTVLYDAVIANAPAFVAYVLVNAANLHAGIAFTRLLRGVDVEVRSTIPAQQPRTRLIGGIAEGAECTVTTSPALQFFSPDVPVANEALIARYRSSARALARLLDAAGISALATATDDGHRAIARRVLQPPARTSADCESAAQAVLDDSKQQAWSGEYTCWSDFLPGGADSDPLPGDAVHVIAADRGANFTAILRHVEIEVEDLAGDHSRYLLRFANDAAEPFAFQFEHGVLHDLPDAVTPGGSFIADLPEAQITAITSTTVTIDGGTPPPAGGGFEVRRSDAGWGIGNDRNLAGRFSAQSFTLPRLTRVQNYYVRQYDAGSPPRYSRNTTILHIDYPL